MCVSRFDHVILSLRAGCGRSWIIAEQLDWVMDYPISYPVSSVVRRIDLDLNTGLTDSLKRP